MVELRLDSLAGAKSPLAPTHTFSTSLKSSGCFYNTTPNPHPPQKKNIFVSSGWNC